MSGLNREELIKAGWMRGSFVSLFNHPALLATLPEKLASLYTEKDAVLIPVLYECALIDMDFEREHWVQVVIGTPCDERSEFKNARNPRRLCLPYFVDGEDNVKWMEISSLGFAQIEREFLLKNSTPNLKLKWGPLALECLLNWISGRFNQATFPDAFNRRIASKDKLLKKMWKSDDYVNCCSGVHFALSTDEELDDEIKYNLSIVLTIPESFRGRELAQVMKNNVPAMVERIKGIFSSMEGVVLESINTLPEGEFTKSLERQFKRYSLEYYTYNDAGAEGALPAGFFGS
ncbi:MULTISPECIES: hypothetical protein [Citrobacter freundii complex]|jgi:hypothetical protein|uniref:hypothetical protein n=1 Tax=Citrobacter freundii complex TaxID=1344959 RepID=UPI000CD23AFD|nr:hypothetical protein [Citrobacter freundii complex sp. CFNIH9]AUV44043.1 hypothetical protein C2U43_14855 [Citrobacter freundii complex sp. CFNIH9]